MWMRLTTPKPLTNPMLNLCEIVPRSKEPSQEKKVPDSTSVVGRKFEASYQAAALNNPHGSVLFNECQA
jgi:hypothetical protein